MKNLYLAASAILLSFTNIHAADTHPLKEGLWSVRLVTTSNSDNKTDIKTFTLCRSHAFDDQAEARKGTLKSCTKVFDITEGNKHTTEMKCVIGESAILTKAVVTVLDSSHTHSEAFATFTPVFEGQNGSLTVEDQKYKGPCPVGVKPGDETLADGTVRHLWQH
jgi:hypothetical protein